MTALGTSIDMAAQRRRAATADGSQRTELLEAEPGSILFHETIALCVKDIGHLRGGPTHSGLRRRRERGTWAGGFIPIRSSGVETVCRCFLERCR